MFVGIDLLSLEKDLKMYSDTRVTRETGILKF